MHIAILTRQIGHYHDARYRGAEAAFDRVTVVPTAGEGGFAEFLATRHGEYARRPLYEDRARYDAAIGAGRLPRDLRGLLADIAPDVLAVAGWSAAESAVAILWARENAVPVIMMSESQADDAARSGLREWIKSRVVCACQAALVGGPPHAAYIRQLGMPAERVFLGYNAVDNEHFAEGARVARANGVALRAALNLPQRYMLASARFIAKKNLPALVRAHGQVFSEFEGLPDLVILGDGEARADIETARASHPRPDSVHFPGFRGYEDLPKYYGLSEAFIHVSTVEQWGLVVNEAMAAGLPVIVSDTCGVARTVVRDGTSGLVTAPSEDAIANALRRFMGMDEGQRQKMAEAAAQDIRPWGPGRFGDGLRAAADAASGATPGGRLGPIDRMVLTRMMRASINAVS